MAHIKSCIIVGAFFALLASNEAKIGNEINPVGARVDIIDDIEAFQTAHSHVQITPLNATRNVHQQIIYKLGNRVVGDRLVGTATDSKTYPTLKDVTLNIAYPTSGVGAIITYVQIVVNQSSKLYKGYVVSGGIGQRFIQIVIEAHSTLFFNYNAQIFGI
ncbi:uncharacterized protein LOC129776078 [Toxorhynchites rutilus septentrionalis]|uniref:uncharacterized protein LOC129776078 n=1 Tax=Toxorhynchites rutilus septentrionalis TaxID=329112 RepID=UPI002479ED1E|nr:uncharacterized protein LOC129776078 [Toxorhynchites rutilus septentrionalis]